MFKIMAIKIEPRIKKAPEVQEVLTKYGCLIQTRIGLHEASQDSCANSGLILLNLLDNEKEEVSKLQVELNNIKGTVAKLLEI
ncbi:hypothetical protein [Clostridium sp.]|uniref:hypothetical protein n=1 Tax=Clostridium sp. TaxID=1506 RepID=UPI00260BDD18|nr:hypothetical protein [Clostridium sp.]